MTGSLHMGGHHRLVVWTLIVLATLLCLVSTLTLWVKRQMLDNDSWKRASAQLIQDQQVRSALATYSVNQLYENVDVEAALQQRLPDQFDALAAPLAASLERPAQNAVELLLQRPRVQALWVNASSRAHDRLIAILDNKTRPGVSTGNGTVTVDIGTVVQDLGAQLGIRDSILAKMPPSTGQITLLQSDQLSSAQKAVKVLRFLSPFLLILVLAMYGAAVYLARGARRVTLRTVGWAFVLVGLLTLVARTIIGNYVVNALASEEYRGVGHRVWLIGTQILGEMGWALVFYGVVTVLATFLAGPTRIAVAARNAAAPTLIERQGLVWGATAGLLLVLVWWGGTPALRTWWGVVLAACLLAAGVVALRHQVIAEAAGTEPPRDDSPAPDAATHVTT